MRLLQLVVMNGICGLALLSLALTMNFTIKTPPPYIVDP
jgi:hypothetical protein